MLTPHPLRVALLTTSRAPGLEYLLAFGSRRGGVYDLVSGIATDPASAVPARLGAAGIPAATHDIATFYQHRHAPRRDLVAREDFDRQLVERLAHDHPDLVVLCGYLHIVTAPLLEAYPLRVINVHDADLAVTDAAGRPRYRGLHATRDAVFAGEARTRSTVHVVTREVDVGPLLVRSWAFPTHPMLGPAREWGATDILKAYAYAQREWMMRAAWGPLLARAIELYATGQVVLQDGRLTVAGAARPEELAAPDARAARRVRLERSA
jgi:folate-dependent phosphoribosylglycinamide formyltransferase PurN